MDREDKRRYFIVGSVILEVVTPLFQQRLENQYNNLGIGSLQAFLNQQPVIHILFHLRHRNVWCCTDTTKCTNHLSLPITYSQWNLLYKENPKPGHSLCHCNYTANAVRLEQIDITFAAFLLLNCCSLGQVEENAIKILRKFKNNYLSHNTKGSITLAEYNTLWSDLKTYVLQLDPSKEDDLVRIENRPLDEALCNKYFTCLLDIHKRLDEINGSIQGLNTSVQTMATNTQDSIQGLNTSVQTMDTNINRLNTSVETIDTTIQGFIQANQGMNNSVQTISSTVQELLQLAKIGANCQCYKNSTGYQCKPYKLGQDIFQQHNQINLKAVLNDDRMGWITGGAMMDDGRLVVCFYGLRRLLICNTDGSEVDFIQLNFKQLFNIPWDVKAVNNSTVAVKLLYGNCIEMYDINKKHKLKSIPVPVGCYGITTVNNMLVVGCDRRLLMIDLQTGAVIQTIHTDCDPYRVHAAGDRIFYCDNCYINNNNTLYCYSYTDDKVTTTTLPSQPFMITSLQDGSLYVRCSDGSVQHVSSDGRHCKTVKSVGLELLLDNIVITYNPNQQQLMTCGIITAEIKVFKMK